jgi:hypothetical protein
MTFSPLNLFFLLVPEPYLTLWLRRIFLVLSGNLFFNLDGRGTCGDVYDIINVRDEVPRIRELNRPVGSACLETSIAEQALSLSV